MKKENGLESQQVQIFGKSDFSLILAPVIANCQLMEKQEELR